MAAPKASVTVYTTPFCGYCYLAKRLLSGKGVTFREIDVSGRSDLRVWLAQVSGQRTVPQIFVNGRSVGGYVELAALDRGGRLDALLAEAPSESDPAVFA